MQFVKMHGLGNDFIIAREDQPDLKPEHYANLAVKLCDRNFGIGADGLVIIGRDPHHDIFMRIFNPDGSEPEMCGNAIRCVARYAWDVGLVFSPRISVRTLAGPRYPELILEEGRVISVRVDMGEPILERSLIPMLGEPGPVIGEELTTPAGCFRITAVSMGNPHCVIFVDDFARVKLSELGPVIESYPLFPSKTNVEFVKIESKERISMRVWERGAGETLACGTGACASLVASFLNGFTDRQARVCLQGGELFIEWSAADNHVYMTGEATLVFTGQISLDTLTNT